MSRGKIHTLIIQHPTLTARDAEGGFFQTFDTVEVAGRATTPSRAEQAVHAQSGEQIDCVALVPRATTIVREDKVRVENTESLGLDGEYEILGVRPNALHLRVMLRRFEA